MSACSKLTLVMPASAHRAAASSSDVASGGRERLAVELGAERLDTRVADGWTAFSCEFTVDGPAAGTSPDE